MQKSGPSASTTVDGFLTRLIDSSFPPFVDPGGGGGPLVDAGGPGGPRVEAGGSALLLCEEMEGLLDMRLTG